jgi:hypothetical protein
MSASARAAKMQYTCLSIAFELESGATLLEQETIYGCDAGYAPTALRTRYGDTSWFAPLSGWGLAARGGAGATRIRRAYGMHYRPGVPV